MASYLLSVHGPAEMDAAACRCAQEVREFLPDPTV